MIDLRCVVNIFYAFEIVRMYDTLGRASVSGDLLVEFTNMCILINKMFTML
jgi:hypothetical protein